MNRSVFTKSYTTAAIFRLNESLERIITCVQKLEDTQLWSAPNESLNSVGNLVLHLSGNITQYVIAGLGKTSDSRNRAAEFNTTGLSKQALIDTISNTIDSANAVLGKLNDTDLLERKNIQGFELNGIDIILHVVEHCSYHTGQITLWTKYLLNIDLSYYGGMDLDLKNDLPI